MADTRRAVRRLYVCALLLLTAFAPGATPAGEASRRSARAGAATRHARAQGPRRDTPARRGRTRAPTRRRRAP
jgi:hypothetical protein